MKKLLTIILIFIGLSCLAQENVRFCGFAYKLGDTRILVPYDFKPIEQITIKGETKNKIQISQHLKETKPIIVKKTESFRRTLVIGDTVDLTHVDLASILRGSVGLSITTRLPML